MPLRLYRLPVFERSGRRLGAEEMAIARKPYYEAGIESKIRVVIYREGERCFAVLAGSHDEVRRFLSRMN